MLDQGHFYFNLRLGVKWLCPITPPPPLGHPIWCGALLIHSYIILLHSVYMESIWSKHVIRKN